MDSDPTILDSSINYNENVLLLNSSQRDDAFPDFKRRSTAITPRDSLLSLFPEEEVKHGEYLTHLLLLKHTREYANAVEDSILLLKQGRERITQSVMTWLGSQIQDGSSGSDDLSQIGSKVLVISEAIKKLHDEDILVFWTSGERETVLKHLVCISKSTVKLRKKLGRIKDSLGDRVKNLRKAVIKCDCQINIPENVALSDIYYNWIKQDPLLSRSHTSQQRKDKASKSSRTISAIKKTVMTMATCGQLYSSDRMDEELTDKSSDDESTDCLSAVTSQKVKRGQWSKNKKDITMLHKAGSNETDSMYEGCLDNLQLNSIPSPTLSSEVTSSVSNYTTQSRLSTVSVGDTIIRKRPIIASKKHLQTIASNLAPPKPSQHDYPPLDDVFEATESSYHKKAHEPEVHLKDKIENTAADAGTDSFSSSAESMQYPSFKTLHFNAVLDGIEKTLQPPFKHNMTDAAKNLKGSSRQEDVKQEETNYNCISESEESLEDTEECLVLVSNALQSLSVNKPEMKLVSFQSLNGNSPYSPDNICSLPPPEAITLSIHPPSPSVKRVLSESMRKQIESIRDTKERIDKVVNKIIETIRGIELDWISPPEHLIQSKTPKELYHFLDFVVDIVELTNKPEFASRLYPEDKHEIESVLEPVFKEAATCHLVLGELLTLIEVDTRYLKELVSKFPKGHLVVRDWVRDPAVDEELDEVEHFTDFDVDMEELFA